MLCRPSANLLPGLSLLLISSGAWADEPAPAEADPPAQPQGEATNDPAQGSTTPASAEVEELSFDEVEDAPPPAPTGISHWYDLVHLSGRFDVLYELDNPGNPPPADGEEPPPARHHLRNYHHFVFVKATPNPKLTLEAELVDQAYYELRYRPVERLELKAGKIWVPFGSTPFHHYYGGRQGSPYLGLLVPNVWAEYGAAMSYPLFAGSHLRLDGDTYVVKGFDGSQGAVLSLSSGGADGTFAVGQRLHLTVGSKVNAWGSVLTNRWGPEDEGRVVLWGADLRLDYGLIPVPVLGDLALKLAMARADIRDPLIDPEITPEGWYWRYGDYAELSYGGIREHATFRLRYGTVIDYNLAVTQKDTHNWEIAALVPVANNLQVLVARQWNMEEIEEIDNDLFRLQLALEF